MRKSLRIVVSSLLALCLAIAGISVVQNGPHSSGLVAAAVASTADANSAAVVTSTQGVLDIRRDPNEGIKAVVNGEGISISLPHAKRASSATRLPGGAVTYVSTSDSANTAVPTGSGVQLLTDIKSAAASTRYAYDMTLPRAGRVAVAADGHAVVTSAGKVIARVAVPWAIDAKGFNVPTHFESNGRTLTQIVDHKGGHYAYPIVADPSISFGWSIYLRYSKQEVRSLRAQGAVFVYAALWNEACAKLPGYARVGCTASLAAVFGAISQTFQAAANENKCVEVKFDYSGGLDGWRRYSC